MMFFHGWYNLASNKMLVDNWYKFETISVLLLQVAEISKIL